MKLLDVNWTTVLHDLPRFLALSVAARQVLLKELPMNGYAPLARFGTQVHAIAATGIVDVDSARGRISMREQDRELIKVLRVMARHPVFDTVAPDPNDQYAMYVSRELLMQYLAEHFTQEEVNAVAGGSALRYMHTHRITLADRVALDSWPGELLNANSDVALLALAKARGLVSDHAVPLAVLRALRALAQTLVISPDGVPLREIVLRDSGTNAAMLGSTIHAGLSTLVLFVAMRGADCEPMIGVWPPAARELTRPAALPPEVAIPVAQFALAVRMEDMTTVMASIAAAPLRVRSADYAVFARARAEIEPRLVALPEWAVNYFSPPNYPRVDEMTRHLSDYKLVQFHAHESTPQLKSTPAGEKWLALSAHDRLAALIDPIRNSKEVNPTHAWGAGESVRFFPFTLPYLEPPKGLHLRDAFKQAFLRASGGFVGLVPFLEYETRAQNPFETLAKTSGPGNHGHLFSGGGDTRATYRNLWREALIDFMTHRLFAFGGARLGYTATGDVCFALTDIGRYVLGETHSFVYGDDSSADVVIQPNFDVVFLGAAPSVEATIARFAERVGSAPGLAFRITRASVLGAAERGVTVETVLSTLAAASSKPVPSNVKREIVGWMATVRRVRMRRIEVIDCGDAETAEKVQSLLGAKVRRISPTIFELSEGTNSSRAALVKRLRTAGVFVGENL